MFPTVPATKFIVPPSSVSPVCPSKSVLLSIKVSATVIFETSVAILPLRSFAALTTRFSTPVVEPKVVPLVSVTTSKLLAPPSIAIAVVVALRESVSFELKLLASTSFVALSTVIVLAVVEEAVLRSVVVAMFVKSKE